MIEDQDSIGYHSNYMPVLWWEKMKPLLSLERGQIYNLLERSYNGWQEAEKWKKDWHAYDNDVFDNPSTIGKCGAVTFVSDTPIGFVSWDPRNHLQRRHEQYGIDESGLGHGSACLLGHSPQPESPPRPS